MSRVDGRDFDRNDEGDSETSFKLTPSRCPSPSRFFFIHLAITPFINEFSDRCYQKFLSRLGSLITIHLSFIAQFVNSGSVIFFFILKRVHFLADIYLMNQYYSHTHTHTRFVSCRRRFCYIPLLIATALVHIH